LVWRALALGAAVGVGAKYALSTEAGRRARDRLWHFFIGGSGAGWLEFGGGPLRRNQNLMLDAAHSAHPPLEVCVDSLESALSAEGAGATRVELCAALAEGGTTPSGGLMRIVCRRLQIPVMVLIRPRAGDFLYSSEELSVMLEDIRLAKAAGAAGVVVGALDAKGDVDERATARLIAAARPMSVTFSRAVDLARDPCAAVRTLARAGADRVLSSGGRSTALEGAETLRAMVEAAEEAQAEAVKEGLHGGLRRLEVMAGAGVTEDNVSEIVRRTRVAAVHGSFRSRRSGGMEFRRTGMEPLFMGGGAKNDASVEAHSEYTWKVADEARIAAAVEALRKQRALERAPLGKSWIVTDGVSDASA
jgi:copper homeostasis protein